MKLLLTSAGFWTDEIAEKCIELAGKPAEQIRIAVVNEAYAVEDGSHAWVLDELNRIGKHFPNFNLVNLLALDTGVIRQRVMGCDVLYVLGGNTDYQMHVFNKSGLSEILPEFLKEKVYVGSSAGSMVLCRRVSTEAYLEVYAEGAGDYDITEYLNLVDIAIKPHLNSPNFPNNRKEVLEKTSKGFSYPVYAIEDSAAIVVDGDQIYTIGTDPLVIRSSEE